MELLYIWIEDYKNIKRQGFNFSPRHRFKFTPKFEDTKINGGELVDEMTDEDRKNYLPDGFFNLNQIGCNIINVTGIIGQNGSGKSTLVKITNYVLDALLDKNNLAPTDFIAIFKIESELIYKSSIEKINHKEGSIKFDSIFLSNVFDGRLLNYENVWDISSNKLSQESGYGNKVNNFFNNDFKRQIDFAFEQSYRETIDDKEINKFLPFNPPDDLLLTISLSNHIKKNNSNFKCGFIEKDSEFNNLIVELFVKARENCNCKENKFELIFFIQILKNLIQYPFNTQIKEKSTENRYEEIQHKFFYGCRKKFNTSCGRNKKRISKKIYYL